MRRLCDYLELPYETQIVEYGKNMNQAAAEKGLGDPIGVGKYLGPTDDNIHTWTAEVAGDKDKRQLLESMISALDEHDLEELGYPLEKFWSPLKATDEVSSKTKSCSLLNSYQLKRKIIVKGRKIVGRFKWIRAFIQWVRLACDVMLREY
jgi:hypothetical protein